MEMGQITPKRPLPRVPDIRYDRGLPVAGTRVGHTVSVTEPAGPVFRESVRRHGAARLVGGVAIGRGMGLRC